MHPENKPLSSLEDRRQQPRRYRETILVAEDSPIVRRVVGRLLQRAGFRVLIAESADEALATAKSHVGPLDVLLTDVAMPGMNVRSLEGQVRELHPKLIALYMSGYDHAYVLEQELLPAAAHFIEKVEIQNGLVKKIETLLKSERS